jgi:hypothetical protein
MTSSLIEFRVVDTSVSRMIVIEKQISGFGGHQTCTQALQQSLDEY